MRTVYDVIVIGGGHAGAEAAWAAASALRDRPGECAGDARVALITMDPARIGQMSCNPAIGGLAKGQIVREIDALGGIMGRAIDATGIQFRMLNTSKGAAVHGPRAQADKYAYAAEVQRLLSTRTSIDVIAARVDDLIVEDGAIVGVVIPAGSGIVRADERTLENNASLMAGDSDGGRARPAYPSAPDAHERAAASCAVRSGAVILTTGTFMRGLMHTGETKTEGGRVGEGSARGISTMLRELGFELGRLKTGTPPRLDAGSIDWSAMPSQHGDATPVPFSDLSPDVLPGARFPALRQVACHTTQTTTEAHDLIRANLHRAPMYAGQLEAECGPRYCPSIEDKVVRFAERDAHHVFLEPESLYTNEVYCNGISTSLPIDVQKKIVQMMPGCERARMLRFGYAVEYDMVWPHQIDATCMTKRVRGLFLAGQINCTTGYEEAGGQGLVAGINAARFIRGEDLRRMSRDEGYIGVMMDDLVTKTPREPYRMFTSRAEYRLLLRADNADERLTPIGRQLGLIDDSRWSAFEERQSILHGLREALDRTLVGGVPLAKMARRPNVTVEKIAQHLDREAPPRRLLERVMNDARYAGYIKRQHAEVKRQSNADRQRIPERLDFRSIPGFRAEAAEVLDRFRPQTMGQAGRLAGVNPADLTLLAVAIKRHHEHRQRDPVPA